MFNKTTTTVVEQGSKFIELKRVYVLKNAPLKGPKYCSETGVRLEQRPDKKTQPITVNVDHIVSVRPSNRLGRDIPEHRSTIVMSDGTVYDLTNLYSEVRKAVQD